MSGSCTTSADCCDGTTCNAGTCGAPPAMCGADGQMCCAGDVCQAGFACQTATCHACGAMGQTCCPGSTCTGTLTCIGGSCSMPVAWRPAPALLQREFVQPGAVV